MKNAAIVVSCLLIAVATLANAQEAKNMSARSGVFTAAQAQRGKGVGTDLLAQAMRRAQALGCRRIELRLPGPRDERHDFFEEHGFAHGGDALYVRRLSPLG